MNEHNISNLTAFSSSGGCGCKLDPDYLKKIIGESGREVFSKNLIVGNLSNDDAAVYDLGDGTAIVNTTDFFTPIVDDPLSYGQIAATNAISDIYAMGGTPLMALAILGWPKTKLSPDVARIVLEGAQQVCRGINIDIAGGHSIECSEPIFGLSVVGRIKCNHIKTNNRANIGDQVFLTKPLGTGLLTSASQKNMLHSHDISRAENMMKKINSVGEALGSLDVVSAMTDVTGFGLAGHLMEVCESSGVTARLTFKNIPLLSQSLQNYIDNGCETGGGKRNWLSLREKIKVNNEYQTKILCDPQTSGGLLVFVDPKGTKIVKSILEEYELVSSPIGHLEKYTKNNIYIEVCP